MVDHRDHIRTGLALHIDDDAGFMVDPGRKLRILRPLYHGRHIAQPHRRTLVVGDNEIAIVLGRLQLVVGIDGQCAIRAVEAALGRIDVGGNDRRLDAGHAQFLCRQHAAVDLNLHRGTLAAAQRHQTHTGNLRKFLRQPGIGEILQLGQRQCLGGQSQRNDRCVGRIDLGIDRRRRQIGRQKSGRGVDGCLYFLFGHIEGQLEIETQSDDRCTARTARPHLRQVPASARTGAPAAR